MVDEWLHIDWHDGALVLVEVGELTHLDLASVIRAPILEQLLLGLHKPPAKVV